MYTNSDDATSAKSEFIDICRGSSSLELSCDDVFSIVNVELIDKCFRKLKLGKASGPDALSAEHLIHAHSSFFRPSLSTVPLNDFQWLCTK